VRVVRVEGRPASIGASARVDRRALTLNSRAVIGSCMNPNVWKMHAAVFELARARGLGAFRVDTKAHPAGVVIELVLEPANDTSAAAPKPAPR
jgi:hypothetical protein